MEPIFLSPYLKETVWGGDTLQKKYGKLADTSLCLGESWEVSALEGCESVVESPCFSGEKLSVLYHENRNLFGTNLPYFPFLIKLIDAKAWLSVQIHEKDNEQRNGKNEAWIILETMPDAQLILGDDFNHKDELRTAIISGNLLEHLYYQNVQQGDVYHVPPGTIHAIGSGLVIYEIQQPSDITYRLCDLSGNRQLHIEEGCAAYNPCTAYGKVAPKELPNGNQLLISCEHFAVELVRADCGVKEYASDFFACFTALGDGKIVTQDREWRYFTGNTFIIPAGFGEFELIGGCLLKAYMPK